eukprot:TRINITY_DN1442_c0_g2_i2.p2 TRINITY_DN1442_c0_g2~~TRINITY_DN1442_c0_g2_i2.p2  ORF type:complete len:274 (+),score=43.29 TRINITY_DN1442_c0_g2_i2:66-887(+)
MCDPCCCFTDEPLTREELAKAGYNEAHPYHSFHQERFQIGMKDALCEEPCCCLLTCVTATYGTNWCLRREVLEKDWSKYHCCQGFSPCCNDCLEHCVCCEGDGRAVCMCVECCLFPGLAISATRVHLMHEFALATDPMDHKIIRFNNCIQCLACICYTIGIFIKEARHIARLVDLFAHLVFMCTAGCMAGQIHREKQFQLTREALLPAQEHGCMGDEHPDALTAPQMDKSYPIAAGLNGPAPPGYAAAPPAEVAPPAPHVPAPPAPPPQDRQA